MFAFKKKMHQQGLSQHLKFLLQEKFLYLLDKYLKKNMILIPPKNAPIWFIPAFVIFDTRMISIFARQIHILL